MVKLETINELNVIQTFPRDHQHELDAHFAAESLPNCLNGPAIRVDDAEIDVTIDIDLQKVKEDPIIQIMLHSNNAEMDDTVLAAVTQQRKIRPKAIMKGYRRGLACWAAFCTRR